MKGRIVAFFRRDLWITDLRRLRPGRRVAFGLLRIVAYVVRTYQRDLIKLTAGGLTLVTLLALVPLLAIGFAVADALEVRGTLDEAIARNIDELPDQLNSLLQSIQDVVQRTSFGALGFVGSALLVWTAMSLFQRVEQALNRAWHARASRSLIRRTTTFLAQMLVVPTFAIGALLLSSALSSGPLVQRLRDELPSLMMLYDTGLWLLPHVMASVALFAVYWLMPNTRVDWRAAAIAGVLTGFGLVTAHSAYVEFQIGVARANAIYATLAAFPLLLLYLQLVWMVVLLGAEFGYAIQNLGRIGPEQGLEGLTWATRERLAVGMVETGVDRFAAGRGALALAECSAEFDVPREWIDAAVDDLVAGGVMARTASDELLPVRPGSRTSIADVQIAVRGTVPARLRERIPLSSRIADVLDDSRPPPVAFATAFGSAAENR